MKNLIDYYYNMNINIVRKINRDYYFNYKNNIYLFCYLDHKIDMSSFNNNFYLQNKKFHQIIFNRNNEIVTFDGKNNYILMKINIKVNRIINIKDIIYFLQSNNEIRIGDNKWVELWQKKVDYLEYYLINKESLSKEIKICLNYYLGLAENSITYLKRIEAKQQKIVYSHKRIDSNYTLYDLYNPINIIVDIKERDIAEYIKSIFYKKQYSFENFNIIIKEIEKVNTNYELLYGRLLFPTYIFDLLDLIELGEIEEKELIINYNRTMELEKFLVKLEEIIKEKKDILGIPWIKKQVINH